MLEDLSRLSAAFQRRSPILGTPGRAEEQKRSKLVLITSFFEEFAAVDEVEIATQMPADWPRTSQAASDPLAR